jgi:tetratricopeptide (TPR) repeat protein
MEITAEHLDSALEAFNLGQYDLAESLLEDSLANAEARFDNSASLAEHLWLLGITLDLNERHARAEAMLRRAAGIFADVSGEESSSFATCIASLAGVLVTRMELPEAEQLVLRAMAIHETLDGERSAAVADDLNTLGLLCCYLGQFDRARQYYERAIAIVESTPEQSYACAPALFENIAKLSSHEGDSEAAGAFFRRSLEAHIGVFGVEHPESVHTLAGLAHTVAGKDPAAAERMVLDAFAIAKRCLDPGNPRFREILDAAKYVLPRKDPLLREIEAYMFRGRTRNA